MAGIRSAYRGRMRLVWLACLGFGGLLAAAPQDPELNVNSRYVVETVIVAGDGWSTDLASEPNEKISVGLRRQILALIGTKLNPNLLDDLAARLRKEFQARAVSHRLKRGDQPDSVRVVFEIKVPPTRFDVSVPKFLYNAKQGWSGAVEGTGTIERNSFTLGLVSDQDELVERYTGLRARYENTRLGTDRVRLRFQFEDYHDQWNGATRNQLLLGGAPADLTSGVYRTRQNFEPVVSFVIAKPLTLSVGTSFERFEDQFPAANTEAANALLATLRYQWQLEDSDTRQDVDAGYSLHAATRILKSDFVYLRQQWTLHYTLRRGKHTVTDGVQFGFLSGHAPLFERYVAGDSTQLRGWNKYEIDPLGGNRIVTNSVDYRYGILDLFYDTGAVWDSGQPSIARHSVGAGFRQGPFFLAVAFPVREHRPDPIFMVGMNY